MKFAHTAVDRCEIQSACRIAVRSEVLEHGRYAIVKISSHFLAGKHTVEERVFTEGLLYTSPTEVAHHVYAWRENLAYAFVVEFTGNCLGASVGKTRIKCRSQCNVLWEDTRTLVYRAVQGFGNGEYGYA